MDEFIAAIISFPTVIFTVALLVVIGYWLLAVVGGIGSDLLDAAAGKVDGAVDAMAGKAEGALDGAAGKVDGVAGKVEAASGGFSLLVAIGFGRAPATLVISMLVLFAWGLSTLGTLWTREYGVTGAPLALGIGFGAVLVAGMLTGLVARAIGKVFKPHRPIGRRDLVGKVAAVTTGRVDERFGQATLHEGGAHLIVDVRCSTPNSLVRHSKVVLVSYDAEAQTYTVEDFDVKDIQTRA